MFSVGDRVKYKTEDSKSVYYNKAKAGLVGTVVKIENKQVFGEHCIVEFDKDQTDDLRFIRNFLGVKSGCYSVNLEHVSYKYDPKQAGDTDDDV